MIKNFDIDRELLAKAKDVTGIAEEGTLINVALKRLIERESALRLAALGGSEPDLQPIPRRRSEPKP